MGTPDFSVAALENLARQENISIDLAVTQPDRPKGRGKKLMPSPVKTAATNLGIDCYQPERLNTPEAVERLSSLNPDFFVVAAYGQILSQEILDIPRICPINIHASLLPKYRGASPIQAAILNRDTQSGVTTMLMAKAMDAGDILMTESTDISPEDTAQDLHDRLSVIGSTLIVKTINALLDKSIEPIPQDHDKATYVKLLKKSDGRINWEQSAGQICAHIRAMTPWPGAFTRMEGQTIKIFRASPSDLSGTTHPFGTIFQCDDRGIHVACAGGAVTILELMGASGKRLKTDDYLRGHPLTPPIQLGD